MTFLGNKHHWPFHHRLLHNRLKNHTTITCVTQVAQEKNCVLIWVRWIFANSWSPTTHWGTHRVCCRGHDFKTLMFMWTRQAITALCADAAGKKLQFYHVVVLPNDAESVSKLDLYLLVNNISTVFPLSALRLTW